MPELPEVETVRAGLEKVAVGKTVTAVKVLNPRAVRRAPDGLAPMVGQRIEAVVRRGKYMWFLTPDLAMIAHLGMSGQFRVGGGGFRHLRARLQLDDAVWLDFVDQRTFGHLQPDSVIPTPDGVPGGQGSAAPVIPASAAHIARDPLDPAFDIARVSAHIKSKHTEIKRVLLDQSVASGIGNIYADEALFAARTHPQRDTARMSIAAIERVYREAQAVMRASIKQGGTSFDELYVNVNGESGYFARHLNVYGRQGQPCARCGTPIERVKFMGRSSHICPFCQRPRLLRTTVR